NAPSNQQVENEHFPGSFAQYPAGFPSKPAGAGKIPDSGDHHPFFPGFPVQPELYGNPYAEDRSPRGRGRSEHFPSGLFSSSGSAGTEPSVLQTDDGRRVRPGV